MPGLLLLLSPRMWFWAGIGVLLLALGGQTLRLSWAQTELAREVADRASERATREETARRAEQRNAALQAAHAAETIGNADAFSLELAGARRAAADARRDRDGLQQDVDKLRAAARDQRAGSDAVACRPRGDQADTAWNLFRAADGLAESLARDAEREAANVRALKRQLEADRKACEAIP